MSDQNEVTVGEIYRLLQDVKSDVGLIHEQTKKTNGSVGRHDERIATLQREIDELKGTLGKIALALFGTVATALIGGGITLAFKLSALLAMAQAAAK